MLTGAENVYEFTTDLSLTSARKKRTNVSALAVKRRQRRLTNRRARCTTAKETAPGMFDVVKSKQPFHAVYCVNDINPRVKARRTSDVIAQRLLGRGASRNETRASTVNPANSRMLVNERSPLATHKAIVAIAEHNGAPCRYLRNRE